MPTTQRAGVLEAMLWMLGVSLILSCCVPAINGFIGGIVGGYKARDMGTALLAAILPAIFFGVAFGLAPLFVEPFFVGPIAGVFVGMGTFVVVLLASLGTIAGAIIGHLLRGL